MIHSSNLDFLITLKANNNREWFTIHKEEFLKEQLSIIAFADEVLANLNKHDVIETTSGKRSLYRIYRDMRFSKDKTPFQTYWGGSFKRATKYRRGGYYYHLEKGNSLIACGFWGPNAIDLKRIRTNFASDASNFKEIISDPTFKAVFGELKGEQLKTSPKGFDKEHPDIDLLRYKQFLLIKKFTDEEVLSEDFATSVDYAFRQMRPFLDYMSEVLTTDANGEEL
jgi:uncharacterized protein (TIGR02453 family)